jgi:hypothetical protein
MGYLEDGNVTTTVTGYDRSKPGIFLIGDSIRMGYCKTVSEQLSDVANVFYPAENCRNTQNVITSLLAWSREFPADDIRLVQFNCGQWDAAHWNGDEEPLTTPEEYRRNIRTIIRLLRRFFPNAKLVFATTTAMNPNGIVGVNPRTNEQIELYNQIATQVAKEANIAINDLNAITKTYTEDMFRDHCHLTVAAFEKLGTAVAVLLRQMI